MRVVASLGLQYGKEGAKLRCRLSLGWTLGPSDTSLLSFPTFSTLEVMNPWQASIQQETTRRGPINFPYVEQTGTAVSATPSHVSDTALSQAM